MDKRPARVSEAQWSILLDFLERYPNLARARGYNNSARGRAESSRLWQEVADLLNAEGSGTTKSPKDWSVYVSNYKSKLKKTVADINTDLVGTGGGPPRGNSLSDTENRFLAILGPGFGQTAPRVSVNPFPDVELQQPSTSDTPQQNVEEQVIQLEFIESENLPLLDTDRSRSPISVFQPIVEAPTNATPASPTAPALPRQIRRTRLRSRPLAPLDEARRILSQVEMQRAAADAAAACALDLIAQNLGRIAEAAERYLSHSGSQ